LKNLDTPRNFAKYSEVNRNIPKRFAQNPKFCEIFRKESGGADLPTGKQSLASRPAAEVEQRRLSTISAATMPQRISARQSGTRPNSCLMRDRWLRAKAARSAAAGSSRL
jgi:hypothetical protein